MQKLIDKKLIKQGAEACVYLAYIENKDQESYAVVVKERFAKAYRHPTLDAKLTTRRVREESRCMVKAAKSGVRTPAVIEVDQAAASIVMEYIAGETVKNVLNDNPTPSVVQWLCAEIGRYVALVHAQNIVHGDLTTSNMMVIRRELNDVQDYRQLVLIDFGLSFDSASAEDKAVDLYVLERALLSTHSDLPEMVSTELLILLTIKADEIMKSYTLHCKKKEVIGRLETVRKRGRKRDMCG